MASKALEILQALGGEPVRYIPRLGSAKIITALVEPLRRTDALGNQSFLSKTYEIWLVKSAGEGVEQIAVNVDAIALKLQPSDSEETTLKITKLYPERDHGIPGDGVGMWHCEAVA